MRRSSFILLFVSLPILLLSTSTTALADRGSVSLTPGVSVYEPGQKAVIAWNGREEILILSTDVSASGSTLALEILPLPSNPKAVEKAGFESFTVLQDLIWRHAPAPIYRETGAKGVEVTFHEKIGAHDVTVVKASDALELTEWAEVFLRENGVSQEFSLQKFEPVVEDYLARGFRFFVLDLIEVYPHQNSVEPILYRFETSFLYYPLKISSSLSGDTKIILFLLTKGEVEGASCYPFRVAFYRSPTQRAPVQLNLTKGELGSVDPRIKELLDGDARLTVLEYEGPLNELTRDLTIERDATTYPEGSTVYVLLLGLATGALCVLTGVMLVLLRIGVKRAKKM